MGSVTIVNVVNNIFFILFWVNSMNQPIKIISRACNTIKSFYY